MKNKKMVYLLGAAVLVVWGLVIRMVWGYITADNDVPNFSPVSTTKEAYNDYDIPKDTTALLLHYRDPFGLTKVKDTMAVNSPKQQHIITARQLIKPTMNWDFIRYLGYVRNAGSKQLIAIVTISGHEAMLGEGESQSQVKLLKNMRDSIRIAYNGKIKTIVVSTPL